MKHLICVGACYLDTILTYVLTRFRRLDVSTFSPPSSYLPYPSPISNIPLSPP